MSTPIVVVCGLGRCGTSLLMQMLSAAKMKCAGAAPAFEDNHTRGPLIDPHWFSALAGGAVMIWLDRDPGQQARSQAKMLRMLSGVAPMARAQLRSFTRTLRKDRQASLARIVTLSHARPPLMLSFEMLIEQPHTAAVVIAGHLAPWHRADAAAMAAAVRPRGTSCAPGLEMELALLRDAEVAHG